MRTFSRHVVALVARFTVATASCVLATESHARPGCDAVVYFDAGFKGESQEVQDDQQFVGPHWNDQISSIRVISGHWLFFWDAGFRGEVLRYGPGEYPFVGQHWNDQISSMRCLADGPDSGEPVEDGFVEGGQSYGWYEDGWNGPGFYIVGLQRQRGRGFGGRDGFHGRHHGDHGGRHGGDHGGGHVGGGHPPHGGGHHGGNGGGRHHGGGGHGGAPHHGGGGGHHGKGHHH